MDIEKPLDQSSSLDSAQRNHKPFFMSIKDSKAISGKASEQTYKDAYAVSKETVSRETLTREIRLLMCLSRLLNIDYTRAINKARSNKPFEFPTYHLVQEDGVFYIAPKTIEADATPRKFKRTFHMSIEDFIKNGYVDNIFP